MISKLCFELLKSNYQKKQVKHQKLTRRTRIDTVFSDSPNSSTEVFDFSVSKDWDPEMNKLL